MTIDEVKLLRLKHQYLLSPADSLTVTRDLCGVQAQFLSSALHALRLRTGGQDVNGLVKSWTLRGTVHLFPESDLPLYRRHCGTAADVCESGWFRWRSAQGNPCITGERDTYFAQVIADGIGEGCDTREGLRQRCRERGMTESEERHVFDGWGGTFAELAEMGVICYQVREEKAYRLCPAFEPMDEHAAQIELARRYFTHYGPATLRDAAYFFRASQAQVKTWLKELPVVSFALEGRDYFHIPQEEGNLPELPACVLLAGFDQLMLGYRKEDNPFLPPEHLRGIFNLAGIVMPGILLRGRVVGRWKQKDGKAVFTLFEKVGAKDKKLILQTAERLWTLKKTEWA
ncbi:MAG: AlkZ family DNA glycosylase [Christensenellaceae bacterium]|nr:AlkZ family DNA glycosylase [Christensenellaceae bacterium]